MNKTGKQNVMLVDDNPDGLLVLQGALAGLGQNLVAARSGEQALRSLLVEDVDVILLDVQMPGMDGFETARLIRQRDRTRRTPIIFISANMQEERDLSMGYSVGAVDYVLKPFQPEILRSKVRFFLELAAVRRELETELRLRQEGERELERRAARLETVNKELESFAYTVSHDLRAPLRHIKGFVELLVSRCESALDDKGRHYLHMIADSAEKMDTLILSLLSFSRMTFAELARREFPLAELVREVMEELGAGAPDRVIEWRVNPLPQVTADRSMVRVVLANLLGNALKFTRGREKTCIEVQCLDEKDELVVSVRDNGAGFDMSRADRLFGLFQRLHGESEFEGTGLGLAIVRRIVSRHGGRTWAEGAPGKGATFFFSLPQQRSPG